MSVIYERAPFRAWKTLLRFARSCCILSAEADRETDWAIFLPTNCEFRRWWEPLGTPPSGPP